MTDYFAQDPAAFVEPWHPIAGDRVRITMRGECQVPPVNHDGDAAWTLREHVKLDGQLGTVVDVEAERGDSWEQERIAWYAAHGHPYTVRLDHTQRLEDGTWRNAGFFAAAELVLLARPAGPPRPHSIIPCYSVAPPASTGFAAFLDWFRSGA